MVGEQKSLSSIFNTHTWPIGIGQTQSNRFDSINIVIKKMELLSSHFINTILHPSFHVPKTYRVALSTPLTDDHKRQLSSGIFLDDGPVSLTFQDTFTNQDFIVEISIGRNRIIRRAFEYFFAKLLPLDKSSIT